MATVVEETVTEVHHWNDSLFSFKLSRTHSFRFENGHFIMLGLEVGGKRIMRAYSIVSANYDDELEFLSIKVKDGALTSHLQQIKPGHKVLISTKPTGTLIHENLLPGKNLYLLSTGTGLAPFLSIIRDPNVYERFDKIILTHGVRSANDLAYQDFILNEIPNNEYIGDIVKEKLIYYPTVTREAYRTRGRITEHLKSHKLFKDLDLDIASPEYDRFMICGSPNMLKDCSDILKAQGFHESRHGKQAEFVIERAFVEK